MDFTGAYPSNWAGYVFKEALGYTSGVHTGVDYNWGGGSEDYGFAIRAITAGVVVARINDGQVSGFGNALIIESDCPPGTAGTKMYHRYLHTSAIHVNVGQTVTEGQHIANVGGTGGVVPHLHLDVWTNRNGLGVHWNYDKNTALASYEDPYHLIANNSNWTSGGSMAETANLDTDRILQHGILARNGLRGRSYALDGSTGKVFEGQPLTNANISAWFLSQEAREWRDTSNPASVNDINTRLDSITAKDATIDSLTGELSVANTQILALNQTVTELTDENTALKKENADLKAQVAAGGGDVTINFNFVGVLLWTIIKNFGTKKG